MEREFEQEFRMLGLKIAYYRKAKNLTQEQLAEKLGTSTSYIGSIESRTYKPISLTTLFRIAKVRDDLSKNDIKKLKEVATTLLRKIKNRIAEIDHWTDKQETKAEIDNLIRNILYDELPLCYDEISISTYRQRIYEYVYTRYKSVA